MEHGTLGDQVENSKITGTRLPLMNKAIWCFQMVLAISRKLVVAFISVSREVAAD
jgi:hypothetical protein